MSFHDFPSAVASGRNERNAIKWKFYLHLVGEREKNANFNSFDLCEGKVELGVRGGSMNMNIVM